MRVFLIGGFIDQNGFSLLEKYLEEDTYYIAKINGHTNDYAIPPYQNWILEVDLQFQKFALGGEVFLLGFSMGSIIASYLNLKYSHLIKGLVFISPAFYHHYFNHFNWNIIKEVRIPKKWKKLPKKKIIFGLKELNKLSNHAEEYKWLSYIKQPILIIQADNDGLIAKDSGKLIYNQIPSNLKYLVLLQGKHNLFDGTDGDQACQTIMSFLRHFSI